MTAPEGGAEADRKGARMSIRPPSPPRRAVAALALAFLVLAAACTPGGSDDNKSSSSGPVTFKLQAKDVKFDVEGRKARLEASSPQGTLAIALPELEQFQCPRRL